MSSPSVSVKWLAVKTASEMTYTLSGGALNSAQPIILFCSVVIGIKSFSHVHSFLLTVATIWLQTAISSEAVRLSRRIGWHAICAIKGGSYEWRCLAVLPGFLLYQYPALGTVEDPYRFMMSWSCVMTRAVERLFFLIALIARLIILIAR